MQVRILLGALSCMETTGRYWASHPNVRPRIEPGRIQCIAVGITDLWLENEATLRAYSMQELTLTPNPRSQRWPHHSARFR